MASNPFDQFDEPKASSGSNPFDKFDTPVSTPRKAVAPQELNFAEKLVSALPKKAQDWLSNPSVAGVGLGQGSRINGVMMGAADPVVGAAQLLTGGQSSLVNQAIDNKNAQYEQARTSQGRDGFDGSRLVGNIASPANLAVAYAAPVNAVTKTGLALQGARAGAIGGAMAPVENADNSFVGEKVLQTLIGAGGGSALTPLASKGGEAIIRKFVGIPQAELKKRTDDLMLEAVNRMRQDGIQLNPFDLNSLRNQVANSLKNGVEVDAAALSRKLDFEKLGMSPTLGQITRDPALYTKEMNLKGVSGVGDPLQQRFNEQSRKLQELITGKSAGASDEFVAGQRLISSLQGVDEGMNAKVNEAYGKARDHLGRAAPMDSNAFSTAANLALDSEMLGGVLPAKVRDILNKVTLGEIPFNVNTAVQIDKTLSKIQRSVPGDEALAIGKVRDALNKSPIADNVGEDAKLMFDQARGIAKNRFDTLDAIPALKAASDGDISAQDFVKRFLVNGKAEDVAALAKVMPPEAKAEARAQLGSALERAAFGANTAGDKAFSQETFNRFINQAGMKQKLQAFFSPQEIQEIERIGRVGAYKSSFPADSAVNTSNSGSAIANLVNGAGGMVEKIPFLPSMVKTGIGMARSAKNSADNYSTINSAMAANPGTKATSITPEQAKFLSRILGSGVTGISGSTGTGIGN